MFTSASHNSVQCLPSAFKAHGDTSVTKGGIRWCREQISHGCYGLGKGQSREGLWRLIGWTSNPGSGIREGFLEEVITKLRLKMHRSVPVFPLHLEHCLIPTGYTVINYLLDEWVNEEECSRQENCMRADQQGPDPGSDGAGSQNSGSTSACHRHPQISFPTVRISVLDHPAESRILGVFSQCLLNECMGKTLELVSPNRLTR